MISENIIIGRALPEDWEGAMEVTWRTFLKHEAPFYGKDGTDQFLSFISDEKLYKMFLTGNYKMYVAKSGERIVGTASLRSGNHISLLFVDTDFQHKGIGKRLLAHMQSDLEEEKKTVCMTVNAAPVAIGFYMGLGFLNTDTEKTTDGITYQPMEIFKRIEL